MNDPYVTLGIDRSATDEQVKDAYRKMARKYHPDNYADNPLSDLAKQKMQEINDAYDSIMNERRGGTAGGSSSAYYGTAGSASGNYADVRRLINSGRLDDARALLDGTPLNSRGAEWYYLNGLLLDRKGWYQEAFTSYSNACRLDPSNKEYAAALNNLQHRRGGGFGGYYGNSNPYGNGGCTPCDVCQGLICADCCCECMGGDLIRCC